MSRGMAGNLSNNLFSAETFGTLLWCLLMTSASSTAFEQRFHEYAFFHFYDRVYSRCSRLSRMEALLIFCTHFVRLGKQSPLRVSSPSVIDRCYCVGNKKNWFVISPSLQATYNRLPALSFTPLCRLDDSRANYI